MGEEPTILAMVLVFSIPILAILSGVAKDWLKLRAQQRALGTSNRELEQKVERLEKVNADYVQRLENLEAVVVSQTWNRLQQPGPVPTAPHEIDAPAVEERNTQRLAHLARRLGG